jgi:hypothetical protein
MICERQDYPVTVDPQTTMRPTFQKMKPSLLTTPRPA